MSKDLIPQPEKSLALVERSPIKSLLRSTWGKAGVLFASVPLWKVAYNIIDAWGNLQMVTDYLPRVWQFLSSTAGTFVVMFVGFALIALQLYRQSKQPAAAVKFVQASGTVDNTPQTIVETLKAQHQSEKDRLEKQIEGLNQDVRNLQSNADTLQMCISSRDAELKQYEWLHEIAETQAKDISRYVTLELVRMFDPHSATPSIRFDFYIRNKSNYHVTVDDKVEGTILFEGKPLTYPLTIIGNELKEFPPLGIGVLAIEQPLRMEEANHISQFGDNAKYYFLLNQLRVSIQGGENFPQVQTQRLIISDLPPEPPAPNVKELKDRIRQLEAEKAARAKPEITGKIKEVYSQWWANAELSDTKRMCFDYHFIINVYLANHGAATTIEQFKLILKKGERSYEGEKERDPEWRAWGAEELDDIEKSNDVPLEYSRNGSLWFVVMRVEDTEDKAEMELELYVVDKDGTSYKLDALSQSQWQDNPFLKKARMEEARAEMKRHF